MAKGIWQSWKWWRLPTRLGIAEMTDWHKVQRWNRRLDQVDTGIAPEPVILNEAMISQWLRDHRAEYDSATETMKAS